MFGLGYSRFRWTAVGVFAAAIACVFLVQSVEQVWLRSNLLQSFGTLSIGSLKSGHLWTLITYAFLHGGFWHAALNILAILLIGLPMEEEIGSKAMTLVIFLLMLAGSLAFSLAHVMTGGVLLGASAVAVGLLTLYCLSYPDRPITLLLFFVLPVTLMPKWILIFTLAVNLFGFAFGEIAPGGSSTVGYSAHLGGMLGAWIIFRWCLKSYSNYGVPPVSSPKPTVNLPGWISKKIFFKGKREGSAPKPNSPRATLQKEIDRILDKINTKGFGALSAQEKETLDKAKDILGK